MSIYDTARDLKLSGVVVTAHIDPTQITPRIKKMTQAMLRTGIFKGGWNSKSYMLARKLVETKDLPILYGWNSMFRCKKLTDEDLAWFDEMLLADVTLEKMRRPDEGSWHTKRCDANLAENKRTLRSLRPDRMIQFYLRIDNAPIREEINNKLIAMRLPADIAELNAVADALDTAKPIPLRINI